MPLQVRAAQDLEIEEYGGAGDTDQLCNHCLDEVEELAAALRSAVLCAALEGNGTAVHRAALTWRGDAACTRSDDLYEALVPIPVDEDATFEEVDLLRAQRAQNLDLEPREEAGREGVSDVGAD